MSVIRPAITPTPTPVRIEPARFTTVEVCTAAHLHPSGLNAEYISGTGRDPVLWARWVAVHARHGFVERGRG